ncbi:YdiU family protein [Saprospiraceae bacterium]|nr:YdiU family protein [Saprospiraceae bacterium]
MEILKQFRIEDQIVVDQLPADPEQKNERRQVFEACYSFVEPKKTEKPEMLAFMSNMAKTLGISDIEMNSDEMLNLLTGNSVLDGSKPYSLCYGGHQFGNWAGQLGDGRAINLFDLVQDDKRWTLQLKGAGETPYSRGADGLAVLRSSIREYLCSEAMYYLGVPTTRTLSLSLTGDQVLRDMLYDGNPAMEKGAVVCRVSPSFLRFGNFEIFSSRKDFVNLRKLADFTIRNYFSDEIEAPESGFDKNSYLAFFQSVVKKTLEMIVHWQRVGFVHGVMNTDNMSILGLTIDYGPYGWLEDYNIDWTPNTTDAGSKRYRFGYQPSIGLWNLVRLANSLYPLIEDAEPLEKILGGYQASYKNQYYAMMFSKLGISEIENQDESLISDIEETLLLFETDMTIFFRLLANVSKEDEAKDAFSKIEFAFYDLETMNLYTKEKWLAWFEKYIDLIQLENTSDSDRKLAMNCVNPKYVLRNYMAQLAIDKADKGDYSLIHEFQEILKKPYDEQAEHQQWFAKRPDWARTKVGCSMLSCSS